MARVTITTQAPGVWGSTRMLVHLAVGLSRHGHKVTFVRPIHQDLKNCQTLDVKSEINWVDASYDDSQSILSKTDIHVSHRPYGADHWHRQKPFRRIRVDLDIPGNYDAGPIDDDLLDDHKIILNQHQIQSCDPSADCETLSILPVIHDIDDSVPYRSTGCFGAVGSRIKHHWPSLYGCVWRSGWRISILVYGAGDPWVSNRSGIWKWLPNGDCITFHPYEPDVLQLYQSFDALIHTPAASIGSSLAVHNALASGRGVFLSDLPAHRQLADQFSGVMLVKDYVWRLRDWIERYDESQWQHIKDEYWDQCNRNQVIQQWIKVIEG